MSPHGGCNVTDLEYAGMHLPMVSDAWRGNRMLLNEYVDNGNLHQWLHGCPEPVSQLTWGLRMNIIQGIVKGLAYLHEDIEPRIVHHDLKSTNILLDHQWNPKISDFAISKLLGSDLNCEIASSMRKLGYLAQQHAAAGILNEKSDAYCFGILVMEIITGRTPVDHHQPQAYLIDWLKIHDGGAKGHFCR